MSLNRTELTKLGICTRPDSELRVDDLSELCQSGKVSIMDPEPAQELPNPLDRIEIGAVGRQEEQDETRLLEAAPFGVVIPGVVEYDDDAATPAPAAVSEFAQE